jgi:tetratricopeptide (TPR) repeat protein
MPNLSRNETKKIENSLNSWVINESTNPRIWQKLALLNTWHGDVVEASWQWEKTDETVRDIIIRSLNTDTFPNGSNSPLSPNIWYEIGLSIDPDIRDLWFYQGIFYQKLNQTEMAIDTLKNSLQVSESYEIGVGDVYLHLAEIYNDNSMSEDALDYLEKAFEANDFKDKEQTNLRAHYLRAEILHQVGQQAQALEEYAVVLSLQEDHYWALTRTGQLLWILNGDADQAIEFIEQAITINDRPEMAYKVLGNIYCDIGSTGKAMSMYQEVLLRDPGDPVALKAVNESICSREN